MRESSIQRTMHAILGTRTAAMKTSTAVTPHVRTYLVSFLRTITLAPCVLRNTCVVNEYQYTHAQKPSVPTEHVKYMNTSTRAHTTGEHATLFLAIGLAASCSSVVQRKTVSGALILCSLQCRMTHSNLPRCMLLSICHYHHQYSPLVALSVQLCSLDVW